MRGWLQIIVAWALAAGWAAAVTFTPPAEGPTAFRRDRVPLDVDQMRGLSTDLVVLASAVRGGDARERRAVAQALAVALALNPANVKARNLLDQWQRGAAVAVEIGAAREPLIGRLVPLLEWLASEPAGEDGWALADCICDLLGPLGLDDPRMAKWQRDQESGRWESWVPGLAAYGYIAPPAEPLEAELMPELEAQVKEEEDTRGMKYATGFELKLRNALVVTPVWHKKGFMDDEAWRFALSPLMASARMEEAEDFQLRLGGASSPQSLRGLERRLIRILNQQHGPLPAGLCVAITSEAFEASLASRRDLSISAPVAVLCSAVLTAREPVAMVIGTVSEAGKFETGKHFWEKLQAVRYSSGGRLVVPSRADDYLDAMLTVGEPGFFLTNEVMVAENYGELIERSLGGSSGPVSAASEKFRVIQEYAKGQDTLKYLANSHVRKRLEEVMAEDPGHVSARLLLQLGSGRQSPWLPKQVLLIELQRVFEVPFKIRAMSYSDSHEMDYLPQPVDRITEDLDAELKRLEKWTEATHQRLMNQARGVLDQCRKLASALEVKDSDERRRAVVEASQALASACRSLKNDLDSEMRSGLR